MSSFKLNHLDNELKFFGITFLIFETLMGVYYATFNDTIKEQGNSLHILYSNLAFITLIVIFFLVYIWMKKGGNEIEPKTSSPPTNYQPSSITNQFYKDFTDKLVEQFKVIESINISLFHDYVKKDCNDFAATSEKWKNSTIMIPQVDYDGFLIDAYRNAREDVFSTSIKEYFSVWKEPFGSRLMEAHHQSSAKVTRIFVFDTRSEITEEYIEVMKQQEQESVAVRIFIDDEVPSFNFPTDLSKDFTVIDNGKVIGKTVNFGRNRNAEWVFENQLEAERFKGYVKKLKDGSIKVERL